MMYEGRAFDMFANARISWQQGGDHDAVACEGSRKRTGDITQPARFHKRICFGRNGKNLHHVSLSSIA